MNDNEVLKMLKTIDDCNFVAIAISPWHAHGIDSAIMRLQDNGILLKGFIFAIKHPNSERCINETNFVTRNNNIKIIECNFDSKSVLSKAINNMRAKTLIESANYNTNRQPFFVIRPSYPDFNWINIVYRYNSSLRVVFISIDEGTSSYLVSDTNSNWVNYIASLDENKPIVVQLIKRNILKILVKPRGELRKKISNKLKESNSYYTWNLLTKDEGGRLSTNYDMSKYYKKILEMLPLHGIGQDDIKPYEGAIVVSSSPPENGLINPNADLDTFKILFLRLKKFKVNAVFKLHPRENDVLRYSDLDCLISKIPNASQEAIVSKLNTMPKCIVGIYSTTLITLNSIFGIPAISLARIFLRNIEDQTTRDMVQNYIDIFSELIMIPEDENELDYCLSNILKQLNPPNIYNISNEDDLSCALKSH